MLVSFWDICLLHYYIPADNHFVFDQFLFQFWKKLLVSPRSPLITTYWMKEPTKHSQMMRFVYNDTTDDAIVYV